MVHRIARSGAGRILVGIRANDIPRITDILRSAEITVVKKVTGGLADN